MEKSKIRRQQIRDARQKEREESASTAKKPKYDWGLYKRRQREKQKAGETSTKSDKGFPNRVAKHRVV